MSSIWTPTSDASNTTLNTVPKSRVTTVTMYASGLKPASSYRFFCNGTDMTWACRTPGSKQGTGLVSDETGSMTVYFSCEMVDAGAQASGNDAKYHSMVLVDINGRIASTSTVQQMIASK